MYEVCNIMLCHGSRTARRNRTSCAPEGGGADRGLSEEPARRPRRVPDAERQGGCALCRQGAESEKTRRGLRQTGGAALPHCANDFGNGGNDLHLNRVRDRSAATGSESDQAIEAALQRAAARRQELSQHSAADRSSVPAGVEAPRRKRRGWDLFRAFRLGGRRKRHAKHLAARVPAAVMLGCGVSRTHTALPAFSNQAL